SEITGFPPDFNSAGSCYPELLQPENSFTARPKTLFHSGSPQISAQAETEGSSKIKDRLEALLFAETLQGTLSPNANPGKGSIGGFQYWMPEAAARTQRTDQTLLHLFLDSNCYTKVNGIVQGENQNGYLTCSAGILGAAGAVIFKHVVPLPRPHECRRRRSGAKV